MNKRQKKKNIKNALVRLERRELRPRDRHVLQTYGREEFRLKYGMYPEEVGERIDQTREVIRKTIIEMSRVVESVKRGLGEAFKRIGEILRGEGSD